MNKIIVKRLGSGYWHIRGFGPCNWAQPPVWPCDEKTLRQFSFQEAGEGFIRDAMKVAERGEGETGGRDGYLENTPK